MSVPPGLGKRVVLSLIAVAAAAGCSPREMQQEVGTPAARYAGEAVVLLPRTCTTERSVPARHFYARALDAPETTPSVRLRAALDGLVKPSAAADLFATELGPAPPGRPQD